MIADDSRLTTRSALPAGLTLNARTGIISGTALAVGNFSLLLSVSDTVLAVTIPLPPVVLLVALPLQQLATLVQVTVGATYLGRTPVVVGGLPPLVFSSDPLPPGLMLNNLTGVIDGQPQVPGTVTVAVAATDGNGASLIVDLVTFVVHPPLIMGGGTTSYDATAGSPVSMPAPIVSGGLRPYSFSESQSAAQSALPPGTTTPGLGQLLCAFLPASKFCKSLHVCLLSFYNRRKSGVFGV